MPDKTEIIITVNRGKRPRRRRAGSAVRRGPVNIRREAEYLPRRRKKQGGVEFYDIGQVWSGAAWIYNSWCISPTIVDGFVPNTDQDDFYAEAAQVNSVGNPAEFYRKYTSDIEISFRRALYIDQGLPSEVGYDMSSAEWENDQLKVPANILENASTIDIVHTDANHYHFRIVGEPLSGQLHKITTDQAGNDEVTGFRLNRNDKIFMNPRFSLFQFRVSDVTDLVRGFEHRYDLIDPNNLEWFITGSFNYPSGNTARDQSFDGLLAFSDGVANMRGESAATIAAAAAISGAQFNVLFDTASTWVMKAMILRGSQKFFVWRQF